MVKRSGMPLGVLLALLGLSMCASAQKQPGIAFNTERLATEMKNWACAPEGEKADLLLHVQAQQTLSESTATTPAPCSTLSKAFDAMDREIAARKWVATKEGKPWSGCRNKCTTTGTNSGTTIYMDSPTYIRLLEFGHEQAELCKKSSDKASNPGAAIDSFVGQLKLLCADKAKSCSISEYITARSKLGATAGCPAV